jgi:hypothetical protein
VTDAWTRFQASTLAPSNQEGARVLDSLSYIIITIPSGHNSTPTVDLKNMIVETVGVLEVRTVPT